MKAFMVGRKMREIEILIPNQNSLKNMKTI
jgi:hypothetical protein